MSSTRVNIRSWGMFTEKRNVNLLRNSREEWKLTKQIYHNCWATFQTLWCYYPDFEVRLLYVVICLAPTTGIAVNGRELDLTKSEVLSQDYKMEEENWDYMPWSD